MALLVLLARTARTRIVPPDLGRIPPERLHRREVMVVMMVVIMVTVGPVDVPGMTVIVRMVVIMVVIVVAARSMDMAMIVRMALAVHVIDAAVRLHVWPLVGRSFCI